VTDGDPYRWSSATIGSILRNPVYTGDLILLKTEVVNYKTGQSATVPDDRRVVIPNAHEPIISREIFEQAAKIRAGHCCPARMVLKKKCFTCYKCSFLAINKVFLVHCMTKYSSYYCNDSHPNTSSAEPPD
jgi:hypothetical protein